MRVNKKIISMFVMSFVICSIFFLSLSLNSISVNASPVCCEKTKSGDFCQYVDSNECNGLSAPTTCDQTSFCSAGCCADKNKDGFCYSNYPKALCLKSMNGSFSNDKTCNSVSECTPGCCILGDQALFTTEVACKAQTLKYPDLKMNFKSSIKSEAECLNTLRVAEKGCCVASENSCSFTTRESCKVDEALSLGNGTKSGFYKGQFCSQIPLCGCAPANPDPNLKIPGKGDDKSTMCLDNEDSVYWKDSCGNPEGVKQRCDYNSGTLCGDNDGNGAYTCESLDCSGTTMKPLSTKLTDYEGTPMNNPKNGESWCQWDNMDPSLNPAHASVGSRFYRSICMNGKEFVEPCTDYRKEFCISAPLTLPTESGQEGGTFTAAKCVENRGQSCITQCNTANFNTQDQVEFEQRIKDDEKCCNDNSKRDCAWVGGGLGGKCIPKVSLGFRFDQNEGSNICSQANSECKVMIRCGGVNRGIASTGLVSCSWELLAGSHCFDQEYLKAQNDICRSYGDCGINYNYKDFVTSGGFSNTPSLGSDIDEDLYKILIDKMKNNEIKLATKRAIGKDYVEVPGFIEGIKSNPSKDDYPLKWIESKKYYSFKGVTVDEKAWAQRLFGGEWGEKGSGFNFFDFGILIQVSTAAVAGISAAVAGYSASTSLSVAGAGFFGGIPYFGSEGVITTLNPSNLQNLGQLGQSGASTLGNTAGATGIDFGVQAGLQYLNTIMWIYMIYQIVDVVFEDVHPVYIKTECKPWEQPVISTQDQCEKCNPGYKDYWKDGKPIDARALKTCSVYQCAALGATCKLLNEGTGNETCVSNLPNDVSPPAISPWKEAFDPRFNSSKEYTATNSGIKFNVDVPVYTNLLLALQTDKPSQCKMSWTHGKKYDDMEQTFFGSQIYDYHHTQMIWVPSPSGNTSNGDLKLRGSGNYTLYVRCQDGNGNKNEKDYSISFNVGAADDVTPPNIVGSSINKEAFLIAGSNKTDVVLYLNKPSACRWSLLDQDYEKMLSSNQCKTIKQNSLFLFECAYSQTASSGSGAAISGISAKANELKPIYFRCKDNSGNVNKESYAIKFKGSDNLNISSILPVGDFVSRSGNDNITLSLVTSKGANGDGTSKCRFGVDDESTKNNFGRMNLEFKKTDSSVHQQVLTSLVEGRHTFNVGCVDAAGNIAYASTTVNVLVDRSAPQIVRVYKDTSTTPALLRVETNELSTCSYSTDINKKPDAVMVQDDLTGKRFSVTADKNNYFVQCKDLFDNQGSINTIVLLDSASA